MPFRKEKEINKLILKHLESVCRCLQLALETVQEYLNDHIEEAKALALRVDRSETEADVILRELRSVSRSAPRYSQGAEAAFPQHHGKIDLFLHPVNGGVTFLFKERGPYHYPGKCKAGRHQGIGCG